MDGRRVGVLGGGQLGRMMAEAGHRLGIQLAVLDPGAWVCCGCHLVQINYSIDRSTGAVPDSTFMTPPATISGEGLARGPSGDDGHRGQLPGRGQSQVSACSDD